MRNENWRGGQGIKEMLNSYLKMIIRPSRIGALLVTLISHTQHLTVFGNCL